MYDMNMTAEKAIAVLNNHRLNECDNQKLIRAEVEAIKALEMQIPKKPDENDCCPICNTYGMDDNGVKGEYCPNCGQKLEW